MDTTKQNTNRWMVVLGTVFIQLSAGSFYAWAIFNNAFMLITGGVV